MKYLLSTDAGEETWNISWDKELFELVALYSEDLEIATDQSVTLGKRLHVHC